MTIPTQAFGRSGHMSTRTVFGAASLGGVTQAEADRTLDVLLKYGVNHIDVAASYGDAELRIAPWLKQHRKDFFLATKTGERKAKEAREELHRSLERMGVDSVDLWHLHNLSDPIEWDTALSPGGVIEAAIEAKQQGLIRGIGVTGHGLQVELLTDVALSATTSTRYCFLIITLRCRILITLKISMSWWQPVSNAIQRF